MRQRMVRMIKGVGLVLLVLVAIGLSLRSIGVAPFLSEGKRSEVRLASVAGNPVKELPSEEGSVQLLGTVYVRGAAAGGRRLVFLFEKGLVSRPIVTDYEGKFTYTLPPGHWALLAPYLPGFPGDIRFDIQPPVQKRDLSFDVSKGPVTQTFTLAVHAD